MPLKSFYWYVDDRWIFLKRQEKVSKSMQETIFNADVIGIHFMLHTFGGLCFICIKEIGELD